MVTLALGSFYRITYSQYKTNPRITAFILWPGITGGNKVHLLNLSAIQLSIVDRLRLIQVLRRLIIASRNQTFTGRQLYRMLKTYCPSAIRSCYRTMFRQYITNYSLINYGLNSKEFFEKNNILLQRNNKQLYDLANRELLIKTLNFVTGKGAEYMFAQTTTKPANKTQTVSKQAQSTFFKPTIKPTIKKTTKTNSQKNNSEENNNIF